MSDGAPGDRAVPSLAPGVRVTLEVPAGGAWYEGHFPGRPILPGIGLLHLALGALTAAGAPGGLREIVHLRFRRLLLPGEAVELEVKGIDPGGRFRLEASRAGEIVANGIVSLGENAPAAPLLALDREGASAATPASLDELLPHRPPMRFVEGIEAELEDGMICAVGVPERSPFASGGFFPALVALEMAAQAAATFESHARIRAGERRGARVGYLVGAREVRFAGTRLRAAERLSAAVRLSWASPPLTTYTFDVSRRGEVVAAGLLSAWLTPTDA